MTRRADEGLRDDSKMQSEVLAFLARNKARLFSSRSDEEQGDEW